MLALIVEVELHGMGIEGLTVGEAHPLPKLDFQGRVIDPLPGDSKRWGQLVPVQGILEEVLEDVVAQHVDVRPPALHHPYLPSGLWYLTLRLGKQTRESQEEKRQDGDRRANFEVFSHSASIPKHKRPS